MYKLVLMETSGREVYIYFTGGITVSSAGSYTYVRDAYSGAWQVEESVADVVARIDALIAEANENKMLAMF